MRRIMEVIDRKTETFATSPFFTFLRDTSIDAGARLAFAPHVAHFVMSFADLYSLVLREEPAKDPYQELVNRHTREDDGHWRWFLADLAKLGHDPRIPYSEALKVVWSDATVRMRMLTYHMCRLGLGADSIRKLVLVHCIESTGKVTVKHVAAVGRELTERTGAKLVYFGGHHSDSEAAHTVEEKDVRRMVEEIPLDGGRVAELSQVVSESFALFTAFSDEMLDLARKSPPFGGRSGLPG